MTTFETSGANAPSHSAGNAGEHGLVRIPAVFGLEGAA